MKKKLLPREGDQRIIRLTLAMKRELRDDRTRIARNVLKWVETYGIELVQNVLDEMEDDIDTEEDADKISDDSAEEDDPPVKSKKKRCYHFEDLEPGDIVHYDDKQAEVDAVDRDENFIKIKMLDKKVKETRPFWVGADDDLLDLSY